ncbi:proline and serine-rich protein 2 isoform X2 [Gallus gallus]|uniref:Proline and serine rich 2 n=1 Tax=Gallus gallus TaxID=9031 RepID=A0A8V0XVM5_CHICK|nr:proline and serine-rich protein 2 isoform X2 [Gallus gallus]XP_040510507.1 proline and serine-rich protein 2 isoform X2 [Gallus gallus]XP_046765199.1 proline and serine-rich protein 2 isoform X2 [Gallus gallus]
MLMASYPALGSISPEGVMPRNLLSDFPEATPEISPKRTLGSMEGGGAVENCGNQARCKNLAMDDESMKYLTHEEQDVLTFFEETIDALEDDLEEPVLRDSGIHCQSPRSTEENVSSHSETEDIIDLVQSTPEGSDHEGPPSKDAEPVLDATRRTESAEPAVPADLPPHPSAPPPQMCETLPPPPPPAVQHPKLLRSVPTPLIVAQKMSEQQMESRVRFPSALKEGNSDRKKTVVANGDYFAAPKHPPVPAPKLHRFPSNINITNVSGKEFNETISKAAVNVQERRAQVLANINGGFLATELEERQQKNDFLSRNRSSSLRDLSSEQTRYEALTKLGLVKGKPAQDPVDHVPGTQQLDVQPKQADTVPNGYQNIHEALKSEPSPFLPTGKTVTIRPEVVLNASKVTQQNTAKDFNDYKQPNLDMRRRSGSLPRPSGFRSQGITVKFSGRGSTEEARREALRKLGLLKETA